VLDRQGAIAVRRVLRALFGMVNAVLRRLAQSDGGLQGDDCNPGARRSADGVADHLGRPGIQEPGKIDKATRDPDVGQIRDAADWDAQQPSP
jgi:hypothetical protein